MVSAHQQTAAPPAPAVSDAGERDREFGLLTPHGVTGLVCVVALAFGWSFSPELDLSAADGAGYALGIVGLSAMTLLLLYSLRKRVRVLRRAGSMRVWLEFHLVLGLLGPTAILYHAGFQIGSMNSTVSLVCMLAVAGSGIGGRFLYGRMHRQIAGERRTVSGYLKRAQQELDTLAPLFELCPDARAQLDQLTLDAARRRSALVVPWLALTHRLRTHFVRREVLRAIRQATHPLDVSPATRATLDRSLSAIDRGVRLRFFEQLFALWHVIHVPLTVLLFVSAAVHVLAVHLY